MQGTAPETLAADAAGLQARFAAALGDHHAGRLAEAEAGYRSVLAVVGAQPDCLHLLGVLALQRGEDDVAAARIGEAIALNPATAAYHSNLGEALRRLGRVEAAIESCRRALELQPGFADAHINLGAALEAQGRLDMALASFRRAAVLRPGHRDVHDTLARLLLRLGRPAEAAVACRAVRDLRPDDPLAHTNLAAVLLQLGETAAAEASCRAALALDAGCAAAHSSLGECLRRAGQLEAAAASCRQALAIDPGMPEALDNLGLVLREMGDPAAALDCHRQALARQPSVAETHNHLGCALRELGRAEEAAACFSCALDLRPDFIDARANLGIALLDLRRMAAAEACHRAALAADPSRAEVHCNLGNLLREQTLLDQAVSCYRRAIALRPDLADAHMNLGMALLARGELAEGWAEYEWRWRTKQLRGAARRLAQPQWRGEAGGGRTLLLHAEQGFGDTLQFCRYAPMAAARGWRVILEVEAPMARLLRCLPGVAEVVARGDGAPPPFDCHCPLLSAPRAFGTVLATIPGPGAYLRADPAEEAGWRARLGPGAGLKVGLAWAGNARQEAPLLAALDRRRSLDPALLAPLLAVPGVRFFSLQKGGPPPPPGAPVTDFMSEIADFAATAALVANLDLVISVDTAVAHLAAALGRPVWLLDRFDHCWRWLAGRRDSPWYPGLRIYRQPAPGAWDAVLAEAAGDLRDRATDAE